MNSFVVENAYWLRSYFVKLIYGTGGLCGWFVTNWAIPSRSSTVCDKKYINTKINMNIINIIEMTFLGKL